MSLARAWPPGRRVGEGRIATATARSPANTITAVNTGARPSACASVPITGPNRAPPIPAASAPPIALPRRCAGTSAISQARLPAHVQAPPKPCTTRAASSRTMLPTRPKARLEVPIRPRPMYSVMRGPARSASRPPGIAPISVPIA